MLDFAIRQKRAHPRSARSQAKPIYEEMIADQQSVLHRTGGNGKSLAYEGHDEQHHHERDCQRGEEFNLGFFWLGICFVLFFGHRLLSQFSITGRPGECGPSG